MSTETVALDVTAATRLDKRIRLMAATTRDNLIKLGELVTEAKHGHIHVALGFASWTAYLADALGGQLDLDTGSRRAVVELLAGEGMSNRGIADVVGVSEGTVRNDKVRNDYAPEPVTGLDGKNYQPKPKREPKPPPPVPTTFTALAKRLCELQRVADEAVDIAEAITFTSTVSHRGLRYDSAEQRQTAAVLASSIAGSVDRIVTATGSEPATVVDTNPVEREQPHTLTTWCGSRRHTFDGMDAVCAALDANTGALGTVIATLDSPAYRVGKTVRIVKIPVDEAEHMSAQLKDLQAAVCALLDNRPTGEAILANSDELDRRAVEIVKDLFTTVPAEPSEEEPDDTAGGDA